MTLTAIVRAGLERRRAILRCRFTITKGRCHDLSDPVVAAMPPCRHLEQAMYEAGNRFVADMARQDWEWQGRLALAGGPYPVPIVATSVPKAPARRAPRLGPRSTAPDIYPDIVHDVPLLSQSDAVDYELAGAFVRLLPPIEVLDTDLPAIEAAAAKRKRANGRRRTTTV